MREVAGRQIGNPLEQTGSQINTSYGMTERERRLEERITALEAENERLCGQRDHYRGHYEELARTVNTLKAQFHAEKTALEGERDRLKAFAESVPGPEPFAFKRRTLATCRSCGAPSSMAGGPETICHYPGCLYVRAQTALRGEEGKP